MIVCFDLFDNFLFDDSEFEQIVSRTVSIE